MTVQFSTSNNPFATRWVRPGAIEYVFSDGQSAEGLVQQLQAAGWWGQIVGPHGSGKSTLVETLIPVFAGLGREPLLIAFHDGQRSLPQSPATDRWSANTQVVIDGYEQLSRTSRFGLKWRCRRAGCGLLVTAHASVGLPALIQTEPDQMLATRLVERLIESEAGVITRADIAASYASCDANVREMLFDLYNLYERRKRDLRKEA